MAQEIEGSVEEVDYMNYNAVHALNIEGRRAVQNIVVDYSVTYNQDMKFVVVGDAAVVVHKMKQIVDKACIDLQGNYSGFVPIVYDAG